MKEIYYQEALSTKYDFIIIIISFWTNNYKKNITSPVTFLIGCIVNFSIRIERVERFKDNFVQFTTLLIETIVKNKNKN